MDTEQGKDWWESIPAENSAEYPLPTEEVKETEIQNEPLPVPGGPESTEMVPAPCDACGGLGYYGNNFGRCSNCDGSGDCPHMSMCPECRLCEAVEADAGSYGQAVTFRVLYHVDTTSTKLREQAQFCPHCEGKLYADSAADLRQIFEDDDDRCQEQLERTWHDEELAYYAAQAAGDGEADSDE